MRIQNTWDRLDGLLARAPHARALRFHRVELLEARRRRIAGLDPATQLVGEVARAAVIELAVPIVLSRVRGAYDGPLVLVKGPEIALDYPEPRLRPFSDLDLLTDDAEGAQAALIGAGFQAAGDPALYERIHHLRPLAWPGLPLLVELHSRAKWPEMIPAPDSAILLSSSIPSRTGVPGVETLPAAAHAVLLAAHAWAHEPLARLGHLLDVAVTIERAAPGEPAALADEWGCGRMWSATEAAIAAVLRGDGRSLAAATWGRHLRSARERTVLERHLYELLAPLWGLPRRNAPRGTLRALGAAFRPEGTESWSDKLARSRLAITHAAVPVAEHDIALEASVAPRESSAFP